MKPIQTLEITFPKTMQELATLDATRQVPYLKARCNLLGIHIPNANPSPLEILPHLQRILANHLLNPAREAGSMSGDYLEWKLIREEYEQFIADLQSLAIEPSVPPKSDPPNPVHQVNPVSTSPSLSEPRDIPGTQPGQKRDNPGQSNSNPPKTSANPPNPNSENLNSSGTPGTNATSTPPPPPPELDPNSMDGKSYLSAYFDKHGPPPRQSLDKKPAEFQRYILAFIENVPLREAERKLMLPPPYGLYIATSKSALSRLRSRHQTREAKCNQRALKKHVSELLSQPDLPDADVTRVTEQLLKIKLVEETLQPETDLAQTKTIIDMLEKIHAGKLAERKLALAESKS